MLRIRRWQICTVRTNPRVSEESSHLSYILLWDFDPFSNNFCDKKTLGCGHVCVQYQLELKERGHTLSSPPLSPSLCFRWSEQGEVGPYLPWEEQQDTAAGLLWCLICFVLVSIFHNIIIK